MMGQMFFHEYSLSNKITVYFVNGTMSLSDS